MQENMQVKVERKRGIHLRWHEHTKGPVLGLALLVVGCAPIAERTAQAYLPNPSTPSRTITNSRPSMLVPESHNNGFIFHKKEGHVFPTNLFIATESEQDSLVLQNETERQKVKQQKQHSSSPVSWTPIDSTATIALEHRGNTEANGRVRKNEEQQPLIPRIQSDAEYSYLNQSMVAELPVYAMYTNETVVHDLDSIKTETTKNGKSRIWMSHRSLWKRRNARSAQEGIRREKLPELSSLLEKARALDIQAPRYAARTIAGLVSALAEEVDDLDVEVVARPETPFWDKAVDQVKIKFTRLGFKPLKMGGLDQAMAEYKKTYPRSPDSEFSVRLRDLSCADEAFRQIDVDNSGFLDRDEIGEALLLASGATERGITKIIQTLASDLLQLYDVNGDGVISRSEYQLMVEDMAALVEKQKNGEGESSDQADEPTEENLLHSALATFKQSVGTVKHFFGSMFSKDAPETNALIAAPTTIPENNTDSGIEILSSTEPVEMLVDSVAKEYGSITLSDLKLDLRRLVFGGVPLIKHITPGGPLILEPFTVTVNGSFTSDDIMKSPILEHGLSRLIAMVLRRRVRSIRDAIDLAVLFGRDYKLTSKNAPVTEVMELSNVEFDNKDRLIMTGKAKIRTRPMAPTIEQAFKLRAKLGTKKGGRFIRLVEPELALVLECPKKIEESVAMLFRKMDMEPPARPQPLYSFIPLYSPLKPDDSDGFDMGEDNKIHNIFIQDNALRFELSTVLRPGRFLGSHYIAFTLPFRTFIITLDRVKEGIRAARKAKREKKRKEKLLEEQKRWKEQEPMLKIFDSETLRKSPPRKKRSAPRKSFFSRFVDGYMQAEREEPDKTRITSAIRDFFGRQTNSNSTQVR